jgi:hypothetical protein
VRGHAGREPRRGRQASADGHAQPAVEDRQPGLPDAYLEIIAIDPAAPSPQRVRWFGLDEPALQERLAVAPRLIHVVARTTSLDTLRQRLMQAALQPGEVLSAGRDTPAGPLQWQILVRPDGRLLCGGALPTLIQWQGRHPAAAMPASGVTLKSLALAGVPGPAREALGLAGVAGVSVSAAPGPALRATLATPLGEVTLESP